MPTRFQQRTGGFNVSTCGRHQKVRTLRYKEDKKKQTNFETRQTQRHIIEYLS